MRSPLFYKSEWAKQIVGVCCRSPLFDDSSLKSHQKPSVSQNKCSLKRRLQSSWRLECWARTGVYQTTAREESRGLPASRRDCVSSTVYTCSLSLILSLSRNLASLQVNSQVKFWATVSRGKDRGINDVIAWDLSWTNWFKSVLEGHTVLASAWCMRTVFTRDCLRWLRLQK